MKRVLLGLAVAATVSIGLTLVTSVVICLGARPLLFEAMDGVVPLLGIFAGAFVAARGKGSWQQGVAVGAAFVLLWLGFWMYVMGRWNPVLWVVEALPRLTLAHLVWWSVALAAGLAGGLMRRLPVGFFAIMVTALYAAAILVAGVTETRGGGDGDWQGGDEGGGIERLGPLADGTMGWLRTFDFSVGSRLNVGVYDCDSDDASPNDDSNTTYMGQDLATLLAKLNSRETAARRQILCLVNGGFFGASGWSVAHHEEPMAQDGRALYNVDLLRPKDQAWFFAVNSPSAVAAGRPRFVALPSLAWENLADYQTVLGGVRALRIAGRSLDLKPGAGVTGLKCSRTSIGWSVDGNTFYVLTIFDPDGELASQLQRRSGGAQTGGWDVAQVQRFWEERHVPNALLFDGGESTQAADRKADGSYAYLPSGYQYSFTLGYFLQRPLRFTLPILPPGEGHRGVLNYFFVQGALADSGSR